MHQEEHSTELFDQHALSSSSQKPPQKQVPILMYPYSF